MTNPRMTPRLVLGAAVILTATAVAQAGVVTWTNAVGDSFWNTAGNWTTSGGSTPPGTGDKAIVNNGTTAIVNGDVTIYQLQLQNGSTLDVRSGTFQTTVAGNDVLRLADAGGTSSILQSGGTINHANAGAMYWGRGSGNVFYGRFSAGQVLVNNTVSPAGELRVGAYNGSFDVEVSGTANWDIRTLSLNYSAGTRPASTFHQTGNSVIASHTLNLYNNVTYNMDDGLLDIDGLTYNGLAGSPSYFNLNNGTVDISGGVNMNSDVNFTVKGGTLTAGSLFFCTQTGTGKLSVQGGDVHLNGLYVGLNAGSNGTIEVINGATLNQSSDLICLSRSGSGTLLIGDAVSSGTLAGITQVNFGDPSGRSGTGLVRGWGQIDATSVNWNGDGSHASRVVADGYGTDRSLQFTSSATVTQYAANEDVRNGSGWFAQNHGKLELHGLNVTSATSSYNWGENSADTTPDLVNSARLTFSGLGAGTGILTGALLATDRTDVPAFTVGPPNGGILSVFDFSLTGIAFNDFSLTVRYDDSAAGDLESKLQLFHYTDGEWMPLETTLDMTNKLLTASGIGSFSLFAVGAIPEPASGLLLLLATASLLRRRRPQPRVG